MESYIFDAVRSPRGKARPDGGLAGIQPHELVSQLVNSIDSRVGASSERADAIVLGCVTQVGAQGGNIALVSKLKAELPDAAVALSLNNYCVSGLSAVGNAVMRIEALDDRLVLAGGVEHMSSVPMMADKASYYRDTSFPTRGRFLPVAIAADRLAATWGVSREELDNVALESQRKATAARGTALGASLVAIVDADGTVVLDNDECVRPATLEKLATLEPAFGELIANFSDALGGEEVLPIHTIAHAPPMCDGAGIVLVGKYDAISKAPRARIVAYAETGADPSASLTAGFAAMEKVLTKAELALSQMDRIEFMEAFGVTLVKFLRDYPVDPAVVNVGGGHMAKGHPLGASGAILISTLLDALDETKGRYGLVVAAGASGAGAAMIVERG